MPCYCKLQQDHSAIAPAVEKAQRLANFDKECIHFAFVVYYRLHLLIMCMELCLICVLMHCINVTIDY